MAQSGIDRRLGAGYVATNLTPTLAQDVRYDARYYDADAGRFLAEDPLSFSAGNASLYRYVGNGTMIFVDRQPPSYAAWAISPVTLWNGCCSESP